MAIQIPYNSFEQMQNSYFSLIKKMSLISDESLDESFHSLRKKFITIVFNLCSLYEISDESLFRSLTIFEMYYSKSTEKEKIKKDIEFITLVCLNISIKEVEKRSNFLSFFTENILPNWFELSFSKKDFILKELEVLKTINFRILNPNVFDFNMIFLSLLLFTSVNSSYKENIQQINRQILIKYLFDDNSVGKSPLSISMDIVKDTLCLIGQTIINMEKFNLTLFQIISPEIEKKDAPLLLANLEKYVM